MMNQVSTFAISIGQTESPQKNVNFDTVYVERRSPKHLGEGTGKPHPTALSKFNP
ncbi:MAG: hypothetical protein WCD53_17365 [Microcoleus sp.]